MSPDLAVSGLVAADGASGSDATEKFNGGESRTTPPLCSSEASPDWRPKLDTTGTGMRGAGVPDCHAVCQAHGGVETYCGCNVARRSTHVGDKTRCGTTLRVREGGLQRPPPQQIERAPDRYYGVR